MQKLLAPSILDYFQIQIQILAYLFNQSKKPNSYKIQTLKAPSCDWNFSFLWQRQKGIKRKLLAIFYCL